MRQTIKLNLLTITILLICVGVVMIYSTSSIYAWERYNDSFFFLKRHLSFLLIGSLLGLFVMTIDYQLLRKYARPLLIVSLILLVLVLIPGLGREVAGARRWFRYKAFSFQPSELASVALLIYIADFIARKEKQIKDFSKGFLPPIIALGGCVLLVLLQPDLGTALALIGVVFIMLFVAGVRITYLAGLILSGLPAFLLLVFSVPYRRARILAFLNPWVDSRGSGFQVIQSQIALGSGGIFGIGLGHSRKKLFYLPAAHTDFIFSIIGEELGLIGTVAIVLLFVLFIQQGLKIMKKSYDKFGYFLSLGLISMIALKAIINIGVSCGLLPTKGLPLPFISYGGSSLIFDMISVGLLINISRHQECL